MARLSLEFRGLDEYLKKLSKVENAAKLVAEKALRASFDIVQDKAEIAVQKANLPAGGKYSTGDTEKSLKKQAEISWSGTEASMSVGFNISKGGLPSIFMMYGTPTYMKNQALYDAFYGEQTEGQVAKEQAEIFREAMEALLNEK